MSSSTATKRNTSKAKENQSIQQEIATSKSPAEFFAEHQAIAGFDNPGKSLYTTLRELVENALDACESVGVLPDVSVKVEEMTQDQFNIWRARLQDCSTMTKDAKQMNESGTHDGELADFFHGTQWLKDSTLKPAARSGSAEDTEGKHSETDILQNDPQPENEGADAATVNKTTKKRKRSSTGSNNNNTTTSSTDPRYFRVTVRDNGCGMGHDDIPQMLGRVLSSSKYGVRQTRGKFGLGAKMALIWSKKSTGVPIFVRSRKWSKSDGVPLTTCVLDIDIYKNEPRILLHTQTSEPQPLAQFPAGTELSLVIGGNWTTYKARIVQYLHQLAVITPYAKLSLEYIDLSSAGNTSASSTRDVTIRYDRRSDQMPEPAKEVKHHPSSVNNLILQRLLERSTAKTLVQFLSHEFSGVTPTLSKRTCQLLPSVLQLGEETDPTSIHDGQVTRLVQLLRTTDIFKAPDASCLSPLGEYNLNLGIRKVIEPDYVATARDKPGAYEGHPFLIEAAVSLGGKDAKEGITVTRFANRIPLLFEAGADVVTRVAHSKIKWSSYKMDQKRDRIGVFVSIVSTKIPFKGTGKEYIGDDITEIQQSVKRVLQSCCQQLRAHLTKRNALRDIKERQSKLFKYVPDVSRSIFGLLTTLHQRRLTDGQQLADKFKDPTEALLMAKLSRNEITEKTISESLVTVIKSHKQSSQSGADGSGVSGSPSKKKLKTTPVYFVPVFDAVTDIYDVHHPLFVFRPFHPIKTHDA